MARSVMGRTLFHLRGGSPSYIENSSKTSPLLVGPGRASGVALAQKFFNFSTLRGGKGTTEAGAFQRCGGGSETQRLRQILLLGDRERERAMEHVAGAQRIHGMDREGRRWRHVLLFVEPDGALRAPGSRQKRWGQLRNLFQRLGVVGDAGGLLQWLAREHQMRRGGEQSLPQRHRTIDIDDDGNSSPARLDAEIGAELRAAALGQDGVAVLQQLVGIGQVDLP